MPFLSLELLRAGASELGIEMTDAQLDQLDRFAQLLVEANSRFNLTRIVDPEDIVINHYLDSLLFLTSLEIKQGARVIDIGTGAGFPGIPMKIVRPDLVVTPMDSTAKKVKFLSEVIETLGLEGVTPTHARAEDLAREKEHRERYDVVCARAVSEMKVLAELCVPFARVGGRVIASKGSDIDAELDQARPIIGQLGGSVEKVVRAHIPGTEIARNLVVIVKTKLTPARFPRAYARIARLGAGNKHSSPPAE